MSHFDRRGDFRTDVSSETLPPRLALGMMEAGAKINRLELTRDLCALESFVLSPQSAAVAEAKPRAARIPEPIRARGVSECPVPRRETLAFKGNWEDKYAARRAEPGAEAIQEFTQTCVRTVGEEVQDLKVVTPGEYLSAISYPAPEMSPVTPPSIPVQEPQAAPVLACELKPCEKAVKPLPRWVWTLLYFGSCGTACGGMILGQTVLGIPSSPSILNFGTAVLVAGCAMFLAAGGFSLNEKLKTA